MDISLSEAVAIARKWESEETKVNAYMENTLASPSDKVQRLHHTSATGSDRPIGALIFTVAA